MNFPFRLYVKGQGHRTRLSSRSLTFQIVCVGTVELQPLYAHATLIHETLYTPHYTRHGIHTTLYIPHYIRHAIHVTLYTPCYSRCAVLACRARRVTAPDWTSVIIIISHVHINTSFNACHIHCYYHPIIHFSLEENQMIKMNVI